MTQDFNRRNIANLLETIVEQFQGINQYEGKIPRIEVDMMLSNIRNLYETVIEFDKTASKRAEAGPIISAKSSEIEAKDLETIESPKNSFEIKDNEETKIPDNENNIEYSAFENEEAIAEIEIDKVILEEEKEVGQEEELQIEEEENEIMEQFSQSENTEDEIIEVEETISEQTEILKIEKQTTAIIPSLFDDFQAETTKPKETLITNANPVYTAPSKTGNSSNSIIEKALRKPISDLRSAIGINEKYAFINELFKGDSESYTNFLEGINTSSSKEKADEIINTADQKYSWNKESKPYNTFMELVERRFSSLN